jgi:3-hydroxyacyl-[acyl-carrier-protein] dehydratase
MLDVQQIMKILQHRYPFLLVDRIVELEPGTFPATRSCRRC